MIMEAISFGKPLIVVPDVGNKGKLKRMIYTSKMQKRKMCRKYNGRKNIRSLIVNGAKL